MVTSMTFVWLALLIVVVAITHNTQDTKTVAVLFIAGTILLHFGIVWSLLFVYLNERLNTFFMLNFIGSNIEQLREMADETD